MAALMWTVWIVGTVLSLLAIYVLLRVLYSEEDSQTVSAPGGR